MDVVDLRQLGPVFVDLETRSCCDLKVAGGHKYAKDPTTNLLTVSWSPRPDEFHLWFPALELSRVDQSYTATHLDGAILHDGPDVPDELRNLADRVWCAHNAWTFDEHVWAALTGRDCHPADWVDTYPLSLAAGLPGGLQQIAQRLWGDGKYADGSRELKQQSQCKDRTAYHAANVPAGSQVLIGRYNVQDVRLLCWLWDELCNTLRMPAAEWDVMHMSRRCNDRGVRVDRELVVALVEYSRECQGRAVRQIAEITNGELATDKDLRSRTKIFAWLNKMGVKFGTSLRKELVTRFVELNAPDDEETGEFDEQSEDDGSENNPNLPVVIEVLLLRMSALKITNAKLSAALGAIDDQNVIRALHAYWGAHTGRDAHRRVQVGNLPKPKEGVKPWTILKVFDGKRSLPYDDVTATMPLGKPGFRFLLPDDASGAVLRSVFVPGADDAALGVADLSTIEARVIAYLAGEQWLLDAFKNDVDPYLELAKKLFGPFETWPNPAGLSIKKHPYRFVCKIIELGCLAEGTPILTDRGWKPIESVGTADRVWNGTKWVSHDGVVFSGVKKCRNIAGVWMTDNHKTWTSRGWVRADELSIADLSQSGVYGETGRLSLSRPVVAEPFDPCPHGVAPAVGPESRTSATYDRGDRPGANSAAGRRSVADLKCTPTYVPTQGTESDFSTEFVPSCPGAVAGSNTTLTFEYTRNGLKIDGLSYGTYSLCPGGTIPGSPSIGSTGEADTSRETYDSPPGPFKTEIVSRTYDILNVADGSCFQAGGLIVHNSLYQLGKVRMATFGTAAGIDWNEIGITPADAVHAFRQSHPAIAGPIAGDYKGEPYYRGGFWDQLDAAAQAAINGHPTQVGRIHFEKIKGHLYVTLPSGRNLCYRHVSIRKKNFFGKDRDVWCFYSARYGLVDMYGGKDAENVVQATARDVMMYGAVNMENDGIPVYIRVHDEIVGGLRHESRFPDFMRHMTSPPPWLPGFTLDAEGARMPRYSKSPPPGSSDAVWRNGKFYKQDCPRCDKTCRERPVCSCGWSDPYGY